MHVVNAQVQRRADLELRQRAEGGHAAGGVHQGGDRPAVHRAGLRVADDPRGVWQHQGHALGVSVMHAHLEYLTMA
ncbi:hypothetical protein D3C84_1083630 [compost metagenome]